MIKHYNIPIFLPELACPYRCVYCNQFSITGLNDIVKAEDVKHIIDSHLASFKEENRFVEVAFFGGNFTGLPLQMQNEYLDAVQPYLDKGLVNGIRCSTRPDYITQQRVKEIKQLGMLNIELGAQSTDNEILKHCKRGHTFEDIVEASQIILSEGITLGLQMMIGLPSSSEETDMQTAQDIVRLGAKETRIYPCIVVKDTELEIMHNSGEYKALTIEDAVKRSAKLYTYFTENDVKVLRIGLHTSDELDSTAYVAGPYHKNFAEMVFSHIWKEKLTNIKTESKDIIINVPESQINHAIGWKGENKKLLLERFESVEFKANDERLKAKEDSSVTDFNFTITTKEELPTIIADSRMPEEAKRNLKKLGDVLFLNPTDITYKSISAHPDIFFFQTKDGLVYAPNAPKRIVKELKKKKIKLTEGKKEVGRKYPETVPYNAVGIGNTLIHNLKHTDETILSLYENHIHVNQGYTRCNLVALKEGVFITSIPDNRQQTTDNRLCPSESHVETYGRTSILYIDPKQIKLEGHDHGFFPGCCGVWKNNLIVCGSTKHLKEKEELDKFLKDNGFNLIELYEGELVDVGSVFFN
ncbi:MAG: radical SAM protein [Bacteroidales bacterium]|nr:radical SAM protein [Bacteroidales bacterium]MBR5781768.1 radical SAM protein [Bacteroidales bacterium]